MKISQKISFEMINRIIGAGEINDNNVGLINEFSSFVLDSHKKCLSDGKPEKAKELIKYLSNIYLKTSKNVIKSNLKYELESIGFFLEMSNKADTYLPPQIDSPESDTEEYHLVPIIEPKRAAIVSGLKINREPGYLYYLGKDGYVWAAPMKNNPSGRKKRVGKEKISREKGYLYYIGREGFVRRTKMKKSA